MSDTIDTLRRELEDAFQNRAHLYRLMLDELESEIGHDRAVAIMTRALERRGREVAAVLFRDTPPEPEAVGRRFLSVSPDAGRMYPHEAEVDAGCHGDPGSALPPEGCVACRPPARPNASPRCAVLAGAFDKGLFEASGLGFSNRTWSEARGGGCCWIRLERPPDGRLISAASASHSLPRNPHSTDLDIMSSPLPFSTTPSSMSWANSIARRSNIAASVFNSASADTTPWARAIIWRSSARTISSFSVSSPDGRRSGPICGSIRPA